MGVTVGRRECLPQSPSLAAPPHLGACRDTHAHCSQVGSAPQGLSGHSVASKQSPPYLSPEWLEAGAQKSPPHSCTDLPPVGPSPLLLFRLPNYQAEVAVWFALFLYVKCPHSSIAPVFSLGGGISHVPLLPHLLIHVIGNR